MLLRYLPRDSALATAINEGRPVWSSTDHLLADLWAITVRVNSDPDKIPDGFDHPTRAEQTAKARAVEKSKLKAMFLSRKNKYTHQGGDL